MDEKESLIKRQRDERERWYPTRAISTETSVKGPRGISGATELSTRARARLPLIAVSTSLWQCQRSQKVINELREIKA